MATRAGNKKVVILTSEELLYLSPYLKGLIMKIQKHKFNVLKIYYCNKEYGSKFRVFKYINFFGIKNSAIILNKYVKMILISYLIYPLTKKKEYAYTIRSIAKHFDIPIEKVNDISDKRHEIEKMKPDIILSLCYTRIIKPSIFNIARIATANVHSALLPRNRGINSPFWALKKHEKETGITVHVVDEKIDHGEIIYQERIGLSEIATLNQLYNEIIRRGPDVVLKALDILCNNRKRIVLTGKNEKGSYNSSPTKKDKIEFIRAGGRFF